MKIALAQINPTIGDLQGNLEKILEFWERARELGADLVIFPELSLCGYPPRDLLLRSEFLQAVHRTLEKLAARIRRPAAVVGYPEENPGPGRALFNALAFIEEGRILFRYRKRLLPYYDVFDEPRYFEPGVSAGIFTWRGKRLAFTICEDLWSHEGYVPRPYPVDTLAGLTEVQAVINLAASPFHLGKGLLRRALMARNAARLRAPVIEVNQVGGHDHLLFDGQSLAVSPEGELLAQARDFEEDLVWCDLETGEGVVRPVSERRMESLLKALTLGVRDFFRRVKAQGAILGLSGGIDSSVTAVIAARALGPEKVLGVLLPSPYNSPESEEDALALARNLGLRTLKIPIGEILSTMKEALSRALGTEIQGLTEENLQARIRGNLLMALSNQFPGYLVLNTGNKSEIAVGYCTLYGDTCGALSVLGDLTKDLVYELALEINRERPLIPERVLRKPPSAELRPGQRDEDDLPPYWMVNSLVRGYVEEGLSPEELVARGFPEKVVREVLGRLRRAEFKRWQLPPTLRVSPRAFGYGWRYPIAHAFPLEAPDGS
ncbi:NAD+ synthase [Thermosulfurimonas marina]|uniref:Glutamine-dependent NAD(+) synthetase n=1 Tax=Thermosulfurimonas marina TaxID=2047767 RepID=A0A6H1WT92_9BACT|nr:NAD+ synthase [Thermosulfurimonas marina]QJA06391.1 NAD+ synthase [Thermosulfurimonas marina]